MREIKFRQWDSIKRRYQFNIGITGPGSWVGPAMCTWEKYPLEQFTGLLDKKGKEIYENDKAKAKYKWYSEDGIEEGEWVGIVVYDKGTYIIKTGKDYDPCIKNIWIVDIEIIGTVHE
jgi:uncharacterized phage protein (TIGR01671 family)